eukprot:s41_g10.t4
MALPLTKQVVSKTNETRELQQELQAIVDEKLLPAVGRMEAALEKLEHGEYDELWRTKKLEDSVTAVLSTLGCVAYGQSEDHSQWLPKVHWDLASDLKGLDKDGRAINDEAFRRLEEHCATPLSVQIGVRPRRYGESVRLGRHCGKTFKEIAESDMHYQCWAVQETRWQADMGREVHLVAKHDLDVLRQSPCGAAPRAVALGLQRLRHDLSGVEAADAPAPAAAARAAGAWRATHTQKGAGGLLRQSCKHDMFFGTMRPRLYMAQK